MDNPRIIHAPMNGRRYGVTAPITQYDYGYLLLPEGVELPTTYEVDFSNDEHKGTSLTVYGGAEGAEVPEELIRTGKDVFAFYYKVGEGYGKTDYTWRIPNHCRPDRDGGTPTPSQQSSIDQLIVRSNEAVETAEEKAEEADTSARSAREDADRAERAKTGAETAQGKAEDAQESAERAKDDAETSERNASESERKAKGYAETASAKADAITGLTALATTLPDGSSATANYNPETGVMSFGIPKGKDGIDGIDGDDGYSPTASVTKSGKVATITITDKNGTTSAQVSDGEDGATGATPNLTIGTVETLEPSESATATITGTSENPVLNLGIPQGDTGEVTTEEFLKAFVTDSASGSIASFPDGADGIPLKSLVVNIDPVQDTSSGDPSPENICPISGWTGCEVNATNENLCGGSKLLANAQNYISSGTTNTEEEYFQFSSGASLDYDYRFSTGTPFKENTRYTFIFTLYKISGTGTNIRVNYTDGSYSVIPALSSSGVKETVVYVSANGKTILNVSKSNMSSSTRIYYNESGIFKGVLTADQFEQFGKYIPINWETETGTVYGGKLDVLSGRMRVEMAMVDLGTMGWNPVTSGGRRVFYSELHDAPKKATFYGICSKYKRKQSAPYENNTFILYGSDTFSRVGIRDDMHSESDGAAFKASLSGTQLVYELAEPIEIQLTPHEVKSLLGVNNIFADTGDTEVEYRADTKLYIEKLTQSEEDDMIADSAITSGQFFMIGNALYRALANIASGATITVGTNAQRVSLSDALNLVNT